MPIDTDDAKKIEAERKTAADKAAMALIDDSYWPDTAIGWIALRLRAFFAHPNPATSPAWWAHSTPPISRANYCAYGDPCNLGTGSPTLVSPISSCGPAGSTAHDVVKYLRAVDSPVATVKWFAGESSEAGSLKHPCHTGKFAIERANGARLHQAPASKVIDQQMCFFEAVLALASGNTWPISRFTNGARTKAFGGYVRCLMELLQQVAPDFDLTNERFQREPVLTVARHKGDGIVRVLCNAPGWASALFSAFTSRYGAESATRGLKLPLAFRSNERVVYATQMPRLVNEISKKAMEDFETAIRLETLLHTRYANELAAHFHPSKFGGTP